jgi:hypothetical protein
MAEKESGDVHFSYHRGDGADEQRRYLHTVR